MIADSWGERYINFFVGAMSAQEPFIEVLNLMGEPLNNLTADDLLNGDHMLADQLDYTGAIGLPVLNKGIEAIENVTGRPLYGIRLFTPPIDMFLALPVY